MNTQPEETKCPCGAPAGTPAPCPLSELAPPGTVIKDCHCCEKCRQKCEEER